MKANADQLCDANSGYGALRCNELIGGCPGATYSHCYPNYLWSDKLLEDGYYQVLLLLGGSFYKNGCDGTGKCPVTVAFAVRCVLDLVAHRHYATIKVQLCDANSGYGALRCYTLVGGCPGAGANNCYPYHVWAGPPAKESTYLASGLVSGLHRMDNACNTGWCSYTYAFSVRCVLDLNEYRMQNFTPIIPGCKGTAFRFQETQRHCERPAEAWQSRRIQLVTTSEILISGGNPKKA